ncbi:MAG: hypothetical protein IT371_25005 [Deltaproteobacteria bacterium]|nr:hypothetical protein [Deltaproteobacteria bacterium]
MNRVTLVVSLAAAVVSATPSARGDSAPPATYPARFALPGPEAARTAETHAGSSAPRQTEPLVRGGIYDRPYLVRVGSAVAVGGYIDLSGGYRREEGVSDGFSFEARRFNIFLSSTITRFIRLTSELEFEHGAREIALETALVDLLFHHAINLRAGILLVPVGRFNITHDSPRYDVVDRPLVSTRIIPSTWSDVGGGVFGAFYPGRRHRLTYELYLVNGLGDGLLAADGTRLSEGRMVRRFEADNNGSPAVTGRLAYSPPGGLEVALSFYTGVYNRFRVDGRAVDDARWVTVLAADAEFERGRLTLRGEGALAILDVPGSLRDLAATRQLGFFLEGSYRVLQRRLWRFEQASLAVTSRVEFVDLAYGYRRTGEGLGDEVTRLTLGLSFRPAPTTALRLVYHHDWLMDAFHRPSRGAGVLGGLATYF